MFKNILITIVITGAFFYTGAQYTNVYTTARVDALAGCALVNDLTYSTFNPGKVFSFADQINMTGYTAGWIAGQFGPLFINKSIGEHVVLGLNLCTDFYLSSPFYDRAAMISENETYLQDFPWLPKLSLAMKFGEHTFGIGGFCDYSHHSSIYKKTNKPNKGGVDNVEWTENTEERDNFIVNPGVTFSAVIKLGPVYVEPLCGISFADANCEKKTKDITNHFTFDTLINNDSVYLLDTITTEDKLETLEDKAAFKNKPRSFYNGGACMFGDIGKVWWILGSWYKNEEFQLHRTITGTKETFIPRQHLGLPDTAIYTSLDEPEHLYKNCKYRSLSWLAGIVPNIAENLVIGIQYDGGWSKSERIIDRSDSANLEVSESNRDTTLEDWSHSVRFIIEKEFNGKRFLDRIIPRGGLKYNMSRNHEIIYWEKHNFIEGKIETEYLEIDRILFSSKVTLTGGVGIIKGPVQFDFCFDVLNYSTGALIGPGMYSISAIFNFGRLGKS